jgi:hypothetical protein
MITVSDLVCKKRKGKEISVDDVKKVYGLFIDVERSVKFLKVITPFPRLSYHAAFSNRPHHDGVME